MPIVRISASLEHAPQSSRAKKNPKCLFSEFRSAFYSLTRERGRFFDGVARLIGGVYSNRIVNNSEINMTPFEAVSYEDQKNAMKLINEKLVVSCHDISLGGILVAISKMCIKSKKGIKLNPLKGLINKFVAAYVVKPAATDMV